MTDRSRSDFNYFIVSTLHGCSTLSPVFQRERDSSSPGPVTLGVSSLPSPTAHPRSAGGSREPPLHQEKPGKHDKRLQKRFPLTALASRREMSDRRKQPQDHRLDPERQLRVHSNYWAQEINGDSALPVRQPQADTSYSGKMVPTC